MAWTFSFVVQNISSQIWNSRFLCDEINMIVKKACNGLGSAITAALLIRSCPIMPHDNSKKAIPIVDNPISVGLILKIFIIFIY
ncbi:hypothetical protein [Flavobacterium gawalongense]|uniref:hypothetical protein n=1 Tax=Flavobacterium gawalongense TaxID=2594432 RepID=UPI001F446432|nr:hypothetical protein [Flavobacterium gawalongense]